MTLRLMTTMAKLHELLAVDGNLKSQAEATSKELIETFTKRRTHFTKKVVNFVPSVEGLEARTEEQLELTTTVGKELGWISDKIAAALDVDYQIETANQSAKADVVVGGRTLLSAVPATVLLHLERKFNDLATLVKAIPTLDPVKGFTPDTTQGAGIYRARTLKADRTRKTSRPVVMYEATEHHPAQVQMVNYDERIGETVTDEWSSMLTVAEKGDMLDRLEELQRAIKAARMRANDVTVETDKIGATLLDYVFKGK